MKKLFTLLAICAMAVTSASAQTTVEKDFANYPAFYENTFTYKMDDNITLKIESDETIRSDNDEWCIYIDGCNSASITVTAKEGYTITGITYTFDEPGGGKYYAFEKANSTIGIAFNEPTTSCTFTSTFSGSANPVVMKFGESAFIELDHLKVTYKEGTPNTPVTLNEDAKTYPTDGVWDESKTYDITLKRTMKADQWNTLMLSFPMTAAEVKSNFGNDVTVMKMTGIENNVVNFETVDLTTDDATAIDVCEPYIVKPTAAIEQIKVTGKTGLEQIINKTGYFMALTGGEDYNANYANREFGKGWTVSASFCASTDDGTYCTTYVLSNDKFYTIDKEVEVKGYRWEIWDENGNNARTLTLSLDGVTTGINEVEGLNGYSQAHQASQSNGLNGLNGKFIQDGRMVIVNNGKKFNTAGQNIK